MLVRTRAARATHDVDDWVVGQRMSYSVEFTLTTDFAATTVVPPPVRAEPVIVVSLRSIGRGKPLAHWRTLINVRFAGSQPRRRRVARCLP